MSHGTAYFELCKDVARRGIRPGDATMLLMLEFMNAAAHGYIPPGGDRAACEAFREDCEGRSWETRDVSASSPT